MSELIRREDVLNEIQASFNNGAFRWQDGQDLMDRINALPTASPWHRVEEPPEKERREYLIYTDTGYMCSCRWTNNVYGLGASDRWGWCVADIPQFQKVVYWMPIEPPKE